MLDNTPLDVYKDEFDISKDKTIFNTWTSNDYKKLFRLD